MQFLDRYDAGEQLAMALSQYKKTPNGVILGLPRGGVITAYACAKILQLPLDVTCPRKLGAPSNPELAIGAVTETGLAVLNEPLIAQLRVPQSYIKAEIERQKERAQQYLRLFRTGKLPRVLKDKIVILIDDGLATGATMKAAIKAVRHEQPQKLVVAIPVSPRDTLHEMQELADEVYCLEAPDGFYAVGQFYQHFIQIDNDQVVEVLESAREHFKIN